MNVALISDTHIPGRAEDIPSSFRDRIEAADHVIHAGDFETRDILADIREMATELTAVYGNADPADIQLPAVESVIMSGVSFVVTHGNINHVQAAVNTHGNVLSREDWLAAVADTARAKTEDWTAEEPVIGVAGHSHEVVDETYDGFRLLNPGSATGAAPAEKATMMSVAIDDERLDVTLHEA